MTAPEPPDPALQLALRLIPGFGDKLAQFNRDRYESRKARLEALRDAIAEDLTIDSLFDAISSNEEIADRFRAAVDAASRTTSAEKIRLLGKAVASGALAKDQAQVDISAQLLRLATEVEAVDLRGLIALRDWLHRVVTQPATEALDAQQVLVSRLGWSPVLADPVLARLQRLGLVQLAQEAHVMFPEDKNDDQIEMIETWDVTPAGDALLELLEGEDGPPLDWTPRPSA